MTPRVAVAIVSYNTIDHLRNCLESLRVAGAREIVVVDNGSTDGSVEMVARDYPGVILRANRTNLGYGAASNEAIAATSTPYIFLLNTDTLVEPDVLEVLASYLDAHPRVAIVGPRLHNVDGSLQRSAHAFPSAMTLRPIISRIPPLRKRSMLTWPHDRVRRVAWVKGAALGIRRTAFDEVGGFDPAFFLYFEETDLSFRLAERGWETHFTPETVVVHKGGASTEQQRAEMVVQFYASMRQFYRYHYPRARQMRLDAVLKGTAVVSLIRDRARLATTRDPARAARLADDVRVWRRVLAGEWPARRASDD